MQDMLKIRKLKCTRFSCNFKNESQKNKTFLFDIVEVVKLQASSATPEKTLSYIRRLKKWLRSMMSSNRLSCHVIGS